MSNKSKKDPKAKSRKKKKSTPAALIVGRCALIALFIQWVRLMSGLSFAWTIRLGYLLMLLGLLEAWFDPVWKKKWVRLSLTIGVIGCAVWFTIAVTLARPNLEYHAWSIGGDYEDGKVIGGIKWRPEHFTDLRFSVVNHSDDDYDDVAITFVPDQSPVAIGQVGDIPGVSFINNNQIAEVHSSGIGPDGKPVQQRFQLALSRPEVVCNKLRSGQVLQVVMAIANGPVAAPDLPDGAYGPKVRPSKMRIVVKLRKGQQPLAITGTLDVKAT